MLFEQIRYFYKTEYFRQNKTIVLLIFAWIFRLSFLLQGNYGSVAINKYVFLQIALVTMMTVHLVKRGMTPFVLLKHSSTLGFTILYLMGMLSICWSVMPMMSCYFAFENLVLMTALLFIANQCNDCNQVERVFIWMILSILLLFILRTLTMGGSWHSVTYSTVAAMLFSYCMAEFGTAGRSRENKQVIKYGLIGAGFILVITTSGGACFSVALSSAAMVLFAQKRIIRILAFLFLVIMGILWFSGATDIVLDTLFAGKDLDSIYTAHGRTYIWELIYQKMAERPWLGWGYAAVERILPVYCTDAHNSIIGVRGSLGNMGCAVLVIAMLSVCLHYYRHSFTFGHKGLLIASICAFINSNSTNFLAAKGGPSALTFQYLLILGAAYSCLPIRQTRRQE